MKEKEFLSIKEVSELTGYSLSWLYKATMNRQIPHYKRPGARKLIFKRSEIEAWLTAHRESTIEELAQKS